VQRPKGELCISKMGGDIVPPYGPFIFSLSLTYGTHAHIYFLGTLFLKVVEAVGGIRFGASYIFRSRYTCYVCQAKPRDLRLFSEQIQYVSNEKKNGRTI
jgi:hypothetical protein